MDKVPITRFRDILLHILHILAQVLEKTVKPTHVIFSIVLYKTKTQKLMKPFSQDCVQKKIYIAISTIFQLYLLCATTEHSSFLKVLYFFFQTKIPQKGFITVQVTFKTLNPYAYLFKQIVSILRNLRGKSMFWKHI